MSWLLGLSAITGAAEGLRNVEKMRYEERKEQEEKDAEAQRLIDKRAHEIELAKAKETAKAEARAKIEAQKLKDEETLKLRKGAEFRTALSTAPYSTPFESIAEATGWEGLNDKAVFRARVPVFGSDGEPQFIDDDQQIPALDLIQIEGSSQSGMAGATDQLTAYTSRVDKKTLDWMQQNNAARYNQFKANVQNNLIVVAQESARKYIRDGQVVLGKPNLPVSTAVMLAQTYGVDFAEEMIKGAMPQIGEDLPERYKQIYGVELAKGAPTKVKKETVVDAQGNVEEVLTVAPEDGNVHVPDVDNPDQTINTQRKPQLAAIAKAHGVDEDRIRQNISLVANSNPNIKGDVLLDEVTRVRSIFAEDTNFEKKGGGAWDPFKLHSAELNTFANQFSLFRGTNAENSIRLLSLIAPGSPASPLQSDREIASGDEELFTKTDLEAIEERKAVIQARYGDEVGGDFADVAVKGQAAGQGVVVLDALIGVYETGQVPTGISGTFVQTISGARGQLNEMADVLARLGGKSKNVNFLRTMAEDLSVAPDALQQMDAGSRLKNYYKGVLVYQMALALQGGNAAARTVSDADIERIERIVSVADKLVDPKAQVKVFRAIRRSLDRQARIANAIASTDETQVWAGIQSHKLVHGTNVGFSDVLAALETTVSNIEKETTGGKTNGSSTDSAQPIEINGVPHIPDGSGGYIPAPIG